jgi:hypothetical protein
MLICLLVFVIVLDDKVEKLSELSVGIVTAGINTDAGVSIFTTREDSLLEWETKLVFLICILSPNISRQVLQKERFCAIREGRETSEVFGSL